MIMFELPKPNIVVVTGIDVTLIGPVMWHHALTRFAEILQVMIAISYSQERVAGRAHFLVNSVGWNLHKALEGSDPRRGHQWNRIQSAIGRAPLFGVSGVKAGSAVVTFSDRMLQALAPHAYWYARKKVPGGVIMAVNPAWLSQAGQMLRLLETRAIAQRARRMRANPQREAARAAAQVPNFGRRRLTLALTAWDVAAKCAAKLNRLGR